MSSSSHPFRIGAAVMVCVVMIPVLFLGVVGVLSETGPMRRVFGWMMVVAGLLGAGGSAKTVWEAVRAGRTERARLLGSRSPLVRDDALARWSIDRGEARRFADAAWATRKIEVVSGAVFLLLPGALLSWFSDDGEAWAWFAASVFLASLYVVIGLGKYGLEHANATAGSTEVAIFADTVSVLGSWHALAGDRELVRVDLSDEVLALTVRWQTRGGPAEDTIRVPIPPEARERAEAAAWVLKGRVVG